MARDDNEYCTNYPAARFHPEAQHMHPRPTSAKQRARTEATVAHSQTDIQGKKYGSEIRKSPTGCLYAIVCKKTLGRIDINGQVLNDFVWCAFKSADNPAVAEPSGLRSGGMV